MDKLVITGGQPLFGEISASGSKNSALPIIFASILTTDIVTIKNTPRLYDIATAMRILSKMGSDLIQDSNGSLIINNANITNLIAEYNLVKTMRAAILTLGPLLVKYKQAKVSLPGGCAIGVRPVNLHIEAFKKMGASIEIKNGYIYAKADKLIGCEISFDKTSVTTTENIIMAATLATGQTIINNAAKEPEILDLIKFLQKMGAKISGAGTDTIIIDGVDKLTGTEYKICYDRIEIGTYLVAAAITGGKITVKNANSNSLNSVIQKLRELGCSIDINNDKITIDATNKKLKAVDIITGASPGFPTDMQAQFSALNSIAIGNSIITETIFENRFMHIPELNRMGANFEIQNNSVLCRGGNKLTGAKLMATDLRASASLVLAALCAKGESIIDRVYHLDRGYELIEEKLQRLGAKIKRINN